MQQLLPTKTRAQEALEAASLLFRLIEKRREAEKQEKHLKGYFAGLMPQGGVLQAGNYLVTVTPKLKTSLVRELLVKLVGADAVKKCEKRTPFLEVGVRPLTEVPLH